MMDDFRHQLDAFRKAALGSRHSVDDAMEEAVEASVKARVAQRLVADAVRAQDLLRQTLAPLLPPAPAYQSIPPIEERYSERIPDRMPKVTDDWPNYQPLAREYQ